MEKFIDSVVDYFNGVINLLSEPIGWVIVAFGLGLIAFFIGVDKIFDRIFQSKIAMKIFTPFFDFYFMLFGKIFGDKGEIIGWRVLISVLLLIILYLTFNDFF